MKQSSIFKSKPLILITLLIGLGSYITATYSQDRIRRPGKRQVLQLYWNSQRTDYISVASRRGFNIVKRASYKLISDQGYILPTAPKKSEVLAPLRLYWHSGRQDNFLTATSTGIQSARKAGYKYIRTIGYIFRSQRPGTIALKQYWSPKRADNFLATTEDDILKAKSEGYRFIRIEGYIYPPKKNTTDTTTTTTLPGIIKSNPSQHRLSNKLVLQNINYRASKIVIILGYPQQNQYQSVGNVQSSEGAEILNAKNSDVKYIRFTLSGNQIPAPGQTKTIGYDADVTLYEIKRAFNGEGITSNQPQPAALTNYTGSNMPYINPERPDIKNSATNGWAQSNGITFRFAKNMYQYTGQHFRYQNANTGLHPLADIMRQGGGDCGNLSSIFISYMRSRGVPARHLVGIRADNIYHAWAEFHDPIYGWIPLDVTYINGNPNGDYLGQIAARDKAIILHPGVNLQVERQNGDYYTSALLQGYLWWVWPAAGQSGGVDGKLIPRQTIHVSAN